MLLPTPEMICNNLNLWKNVQMKLNLTEHFNQEWQGCILLNNLATVTWIFIFFYILTLFIVKSGLYIERHNHLLQKSEENKQMKDTSL